jgi:hypothetical protein
MSEHLPPVGRKADACHYSRSDQAPTSDDCGDCVNGPPVSRCVMSSRCGVLGTKSAGVAKRSPRGEDTERPTEPWPIRRVPPVWPLTQPAVCSHSRPTVCVELRALCRATRAVSGHARCVGPRALCQRGRGSRSRLCVVVAAAMGWPFSGFVLSNCTTGRMCTQKACLLCSSVTPSTRQPARAPASPLAQPPARSRSRQAARVARRPLAQLAARWRSSRPAGAGITAHFER